MPWPAKGFGFCNRAALPRDDSSGETTSYKNTPLAIHRREATLFLWTFLSGNFFPRDQLDPRFCRFTIFSGLVALSNCDDFLAANPLRR